MKQTLLPLALALALFNVSDLAHARPRPDLYPNQHLKSMGYVAVDRDIIECETKARDYDARSPNQGNGAKNVARGAVRGTALGALAGTITGAGAGRGAGAGAAVGGVKSVLDERKTRRENEESGSPEYRKYMEACLEDQGYKVVGWLNK